MSALDVAAAFAPLAIGYAALAWLVWPRRGRR